VKYVILIHSNPQPWGHPTTHYVAEHQALPVEQREAMNAAWDKAFAEVQERGELVYAEALGDPATSSLYRWQDGQTMVTDGPYAETKELLAGFFVVDVESRERADRGLTGVSGGRSARA
jgi:hypothetical protein